MILMIILEKGLGRDLCDCKENQGVISLSRISVLQKPCELHFTGLYIFLVIAKAKPTSLL